MNRREGVLNKAKEYVLRDRNALHGDPEDNFLVIANLYNAYIAGRTGENNRRSAFLGGVSFRLEPHDVAVLNILQKVARIITSPSHMDHWVDIAGYAACGADCIPAPMSDPNYYGVGPASMIPDVNEVKGVPKVRKPRKKYTRKRRKSK